MRSPADRERRAVSGGTGVRDRVWRWASHLTVTVGLLCAVASQGWAMPLAEMFAFSFCAGFVAGGFLAGDGWSAAPRLIRISLGTGAVLTGAGGIVAVFGLAGAVWLLALLAISPAVRYCIEHRWLILGDDPTPSTRHVPADTSSEVPSEPGFMRAPLTDDLETLDDAGLCLAWRRSFLMLEGARNEHDRMALVVQRQRYLDELQRRCPDGVAAWLASGARASSNPMPFLGNGSREER